MLLPRLAAARGKNNGQNKDKSRRRKQAKAQAAGCWRSGACLPGKGANVSRCDLSSITTFPLDSTGSNLSRANLRGVNARGVNFSKANLSGACLVDADFTNATFAKNTNLANATFCRTIMPDGSTKNSGCSAGTACCPTCTSDSQCPLNQRCVDGTCRTCDVCASGCAFTSVQAAINATTPQLTTIRVCPGTYVENDESLIAMAIRRSLTLIGAGDGDDPTTNTILRPAAPDQLVVGAFNAGVVRLESLRITGGSGPNGQGTRVINSTLTMANCTVVDNHPGVGVPTTGGLLATTHAQVTLINTRITRNSGLNAGGILVSTGCAVILDALSRVTDNRATGQSPVGGGIFAVGSVTLPSVDNVTGNTPNNCHGNTFAGPGAICTTT